MYKIGIIGDRESVLGFISLGASVFEANTSDDAERLLHQLVKSGAYAVIFVTEQLFSRLQDALVRYKDLPLPAITVIPGKGGSRGYGMTALQSAVRRAVGADILFKE